MVVVSDGDQNAWRAARRAAAELGLGLLDCTSGNPTTATYAEVLAALVASKHDVVVVLADDGGLTGFGPGERLITWLARAPEVEVLAAVAVASWAHHDGDVVVDASVTATGRVVPWAVDKNGLPMRGRRLRGDTVDVLDELQVPVVGVGDIGEEGHACDADTLRRAIVEALRLGGHVQTSVDEPIQ
ncbi:MAG: stage V sporulation protein AE [Chloroflexota bacterium]